MGDIEKRGLVVVICGRKNSSKSETLKYLLGQLNNFDSYDCGPLMTDEVQRGSEIGKYFEKKFAKDNFFLDLDYQKKGFDFFVSKGAYAPNSINVGLPRSIYQLKLTNEYCEQNGLELKVIKLNVDDDIFKQRWIERKNKGHTRYYDSEIEDALKLDQMFYSQVKPMAKFAKEKLNGNYLEIDTYQRLRDGDKPNSINREIDDYGEVILDFILK